MLIYSICYYYGKNKKENINTHIDCFLQINKENDLFLVCIMIDSHDIEVHNKIRYEILEYVKSNYNINFDIITNFNWGGTIVALYDTYQYSKKIYNNLNPYIALFEEDFYSINKLFLNDSINLLNNNNNIYIGESNIGRIKKNNDDNRQTGYKTNTHLTNEEVWTDGGYYFSNLINLIKIEDKIGIFHKGNKNTKYDRSEDGISIGEVGFPTLLYNHNFNFDILNRSDYFVHNK